MSSRQEIADYLTNHPKVEIRDLEAVLDKLEAIRADGLEKFYVISDFDATISKHHHSSDPTKTRLPSSFGVLEQDPSLPKSVAEFAQNNYKKYYPIEMDFSLDPEEKEKLMVKWWSSTQNAVVEAKTVTSKSLLETVIKSNICLRENCDKFINSTFERNIPLLIFSAGCGDIIDKMLKHKEPICWHEENMLIVGNMMNFDSETDLLTGFAKPTIHSMNKSHALDRMKANTNDQSKFQKLTKMVDNRTNLFVMGDHLRDGNMKVGMPNIKTFIDFGFLNYSAEKNLETYKDTFDIVLNDDQSFDVVNRLFEFVCG